MCCSSSAFGVEIVLDTDVLSVATVGCGVLVLDALSLTTVYASLDPTHCLGVRDHHMIVLPSIDSLCDIGLTGVSVSVFFQTFVSIKGSVISVVHRPVAINAVPSASRRCVPCRNALCAAFVRSIRRWPTWLKALSARCQGWRNALWAAFVHSIRRWPTWLKALSAR